MSLPDVTITIADPALGLAPPDTSRQQAKVGVCSLGTNNQVYTFGDPVALAAALGRGPLVDAALDTLIATGQPVVCVPVESDVAGAVSSVTHAGTGTGTAAISGTPNDSFDLIVKFVTGAANLAALPTFKYSLDGGRTYSGVITAAASYVIPNTGLTLGLTNGSGTSWVAGDTYSFTCSAPGATATKYMAAVDALLADSSEWFMCHLVGVQADTATAATFFATLDSKAAAMEAAYRYAFFLMELPEDTDANIKTAFTALAASSKRVAVAAGMCALASKLTAGSLLKRPVGWPVATRLSAIRAGSDAGRFASGSLPGVTLPSGFRDERSTPGLDAINLITLRTFVGVGGIFITNGKMKSGTTSDYQVITNRRVVDIGCKAVRNSALSLINESVRVNPTGAANAGRILEADARAIDAQVGQALSSAVVATGDASASQVVTSRTDNIISDGVLNILARITPLGYARSIAVNIGLTNPAIAA